MIVSHIPAVTVILLLSSCIVSALQVLPWNRTEYMFVFGDSYSTDGYDVTAGINSLDPGYVSITLHF